MFICVYRRERPTEIDGGYHDREKDSAQQEIKYRHCYPNYLLKMNTYNLEAIHVTSWA